MVRDIKINEIKTDDDVYREIFNQFHLPFSERLENACQYAMEEISNKARFRDIWNLFLQTGCIMVNSNNQLRQKF